MVSGYSLGRDGFLLNKSLVLVAVETGPVCNIQEREQRQHYAPLHRRAIDRVTIEVERCVFRTSGCGTG